MRKFFILMAGIAVIFMFAPATASAECGVCGDLNGDGSVNILDIAAFVNWYLKYGPPPACPDAADVNCDNAVRVNCYNPNYECDDLQYLINYIYLGGPPPCDPDNDGNPNCDYY